MFGSFFGGKSPPVKSLQDIARLFSTHGVKKAGDILREQAANGNQLAQSFLSQAALMYREDPRIANEFESYTAMAAESGDAVSQYNYAKICFNRIDGSKGFLDHDDQENVKLAKYWHGKAAAQGFAPAKQSLANLAVFDF